MRQRLKPNTGRRCPEASAVSGLQEESSKPTHREDNEDAILPSAPPGYVSKSCGQCCICNL